MSTRVLIVDDEHEVAGLVADALDLEGFDTRLSTGAHALSDALSFVPDVILLDLMMPGVDGFEAARQLRRDGRTGTTPIVVMTARHDGRSKAAEMGIQHFLAKPFDVSELISTLNLATHVP